MENYKYIYGFNAICKGGEVIEIKDLYTDSQRLEGVRVFAYCADCDCPMEPKPKSFKCPKCGRIYRMTKINASKEWTIEENEDYEDYY